MMLILIFMHSYLVHNGLGLPVSHPHVHSTNSPVPNIMEDQASSTCNDVHSCRTLTNIVWSCLTTIFACIWTAIHRNISGPDQGMLAGILEKMKIVIVALLVPEWVLAWAIRQFINARTIGLELEAARIKARGVWAAKWKVFLGKEYLRDNNEPQIEDKQSQEEAERPDGNGEISSSRDEGSQEDERPLCRDEQSPTIRDESEGENGLTTTADVFRNMNHESNEERNPLWDQRNGSTETLISRREAEEVSPEQVEAVERHIEGRRTSGIFEDIVTEEENGRLDEKCTTIHGFFVIMGGFHAYNQGKPLYPLSSKDVIDLVRTGQLILPTKKEIEGMGQGDWLSKVLTVTQTFWFIAQCVARRVEHLPITQLEIMTLAYTTITVAMYAFWWLKPLNTQCPLRIAMKKPVKKDPEPKWPFYPASKVVWTIAGWHDNLMTMEQVWEARDQVPTFFGGDSKVSASKTVEVRECLCDLIGLAVAMLFGAIHCIAWSYVFPSFKQRRLWRWCALGIVVTPGTILLSLLSWLLFNYMEEQRSKKYPLKYIRWPVEGIAMFIAAISFIIYLVARLILFVLAFTTLTSLPAEAYHTVTWTLHVPHIM